MNKQQTIDQKSFGYSLWRSLHIKPCYIYYFDKIQIQFKERIPSNEALILAPNHQNALMDAMALVNLLKQQTVFLARADIFSGKIIIRILTFMKILPVYRSRDGRNNLKKNDYIFDIAENVLHNKINPLCLYPEGNHGDKRRLRPLVKGIFRIAFKAQEKYKDKKGVLILPVGIDYKHYQKFRQSLLIIFGEPFQVADYWKLYEKDPAIAMNSLRDRLAEEMKKVMIHIETEEYYDMYMDLRDILYKKICKSLHLDDKNLYHKFLADKEIIKQLDEKLKKSPKKISELNQIYQQYREQRDRLRLRNWVPEKPRYNIAGNILALLLSVFLLPLFFLGILNNWPHYFIPPLLLGKIKDPQFHSTMKWAIGLVIMTVYYIILSVLAILFFPAWWIKILYIITLPSTGIFALKYRNFIVKTIAKIRYTKGLRKSGSSMSKLKLLYNRLLETYEKNINLLS